MRQKLIIFLTANLIFLAISCLISFAQTGLAQSGVTEWREPIQLNQTLSEGADGASFPKITADVTGNLHVIWSGWTGADYPGGWANNTIFYTWWDGTKWSDPIDILVSKNIGGTVGTRSITTTRDGYVVVAWSSPSGVAVSKALIGDATNARAWHTIRFDQGNFPQLAVDSVKEKWYLTYDQDRSRILFTYSEDNGNTWAPTRVVWASITDSSALRNWGTYVSSDGGVHVVWSELTEQRGWQGEAIWHARLLSLEQGAFDVREVARSTSPDDPTLDAPIMAVGMTGTLHLFWNNGVGSATGRFHQWSEDDGITWSDVSPVFPGLSGQTEQAGVVVDSNNVLHWITSANGSGYNYGVIRYASWESGRWSSYNTLWPETHRGEFPALAITGGNQLHLVWSQFTGPPPGALSRNVVYSTRLVDAPSIPSTDFIKPTNTPTLQPTKTTSFIERSNGSIELTPTPTPRQQFADISSAEVSNPGLIIVWGVAPVAVLIVGLLILKLGYLSSRQ